MHRTRTSRLLSLGLSILFLTSTSAPGLGTQRRLEQFGQQTWGSDSGLPQNTVHSVLQTRDGFLWIATEAGLARFDGFTFRTFDTENTPELRSNLINDLKEDSSGALWISTTAGLVRQQAGVFTAFSVANGLPSDSVSSTWLSRRHRGLLLALTSSGVASLSTGGNDTRFTAIEGTAGLQPIDGSSPVIEDDRGEIWIAGARQIFAFNPGSSAGAAIPVSPELGEITAIASPRPGELWVGGRSGLEILREGAPTSLRAHLPSAEITALLPDSSGGMWIGTSRGLSHAPGNTSDRVTLTGLDGAPIQRLFLDREGALWIATSRGIARLSAGRLDLMPHRSRLAGVLSISEDREGSIWLGTANAGLTVLREQAFSTVSEADGLSAGFVRAIYQDREGTIWIGTSGGGLDRIAPGGDGGLDVGKVTHPQTQPALSSDVVLSIAKTGADLWVGTPNGLDRIRDGHVRVFTTEDGLADSFVRSLFADTDGSLWIGTRNGLSHLSGGAFTSFSRLDGLGSDLIGAILRTRSGDLWVGTLGGLSRWSGNGFTNLTRKDGLGSDAVTSMLEDSARTLWIGTQGGGLSRLQNGRLTPLPPSTNTLPETPFGILEDAAGNLWLSSRKGISRVPLSELNASADGRRTGPLPVRTFGAADGMRISEGSSGGHPAAWRMRDGSLWFATLDGAVFVTPESTVSNRLPPPTVIESVLLNDRLIDAGETAAGAVLTVPPGKTRIAVAYAGLSFVAPEKVRYRYRLEGFDKDWIDAGSRREAFYTNVPPGPYRFLVLSANNSGVWSTQPAGFRLRVQPTLLQTRWFPALLALGCIAFAFALYRWRVLSVQAQYGAVLGERGRIAREIHDTLAQGYVAIAVQLELTERLLETSKDAALQQLEATRTLVRESLAEARSSIWNLRSQSESDTLPSQLAALAEARSTAAGSSSSRPSHPLVKLDIQGTYRPVARSVEKEILRVAQEAVANSVRHARATHIQVKLRYDASTLHLLVADDGNGFAHSAEDLRRNRHFGLQGMRERAERIGARLSVQSTPGQGTTVDLEIDPRRAERKDLL